MCIRDRMVTMQFRLKKCKTRCRGVVAASAVVVNVVAEKAAAKVKVAVRAKAKLAITLNAPIAA